MLKVAQVQQSQVTEERTLEHLLPLHEQVEVTIFCPASHVKEFKSRLPTANRQQAPSKAEAPEPGSAPEPRLLLSWAFMNDGTG